MALDKERYKRIEDRFNGEELLKSYLSLYKKAHYDDISSYMSKIIDGIYWISDSAAKAEGTEHALGYTRFGKDKVGMRVSTPKLITSTLMANPLVLELFEKKIENNPNDYENIVIENKIEEFEKLFLGVLAHEVAHVVTDDALFTAVNMAMHNSKIHDRYKNKIKEDEANGVVIDSNYRFSDEFISELRSLITSELSNSKFTKSITSSEKKLIDDYLRVRVNTLPLNLSHKLQELHNILIDIYIENAIPTVMPPKDDTQNIRAKTKDAVDTTRSVLINDSKVLLNKEELISKLNNARDQTGGGVRELFFYAIGPYTDARVEYDKNFDIAQMFKEVGLEYLNETKIEGITLIHQPNVKSPTIVDCINEMRLVNQRNKRLAENLIAKNSPALNYEDRIKEGVNASYYTKLFNKIVTVFEEEMKKVNDLQKEYDELILKVKDLIKKASDQEVIPDLKNKLKVLSDALPDNLKMSATQLQKELEEIKKNSSSQDVKNTIDEACKILDELKYTAIIGPSDQGEEQGNIIEPSLLPDEIEKQNQPQPPQPQDNQENDMNDEGQNQEQKNNNADSPQNEQDAGKDSPSNDDNSENVDDADNNSKNDAKENSNENSKSKDEKSSENEPEEENSNSADNSASSDRDKEEKAQKENDKNDKDVSDSQKTLGQRLQDAAERMKEMNKTKEGEDVKKDFEESLEEHQTFNDKETQALEDSVKSIAKDIEDAIQKERDKLENELKDSSTLENTDADKLNDLLDHYHKEKNNSWRDGEYDPSKTDKVAPNKDVQKAYDLVNAIAVPVLKSVVEEIKKNFKSSPTHSIDFDKRGSRSIASAGIITKTTGVIKSNNHMQKKHMVANINFVLDNSGSMSSYFNYKTKDGKSHSMSYFDFVNGLVMAISKELALYGITINIWNFTDYPVNKRVGVTFCEDPRKINESDQERAKKLEILNQALLTENPQGGTFQMSSVIGALSNTIEEYLNFKKDPSLLPSDRYKLFKDTGGIIPTDMFIMITDDYTCDHENKKEKILKNFLNNEGNRNFYAIKLGDHRNTKLSSLFQGFPISETFGFNASVIGKYNTGDVNVNVEESLQIAVVGICETISHTIINQLNMGARGVDGNLKQGANSPSMSNRSPNGWGL